MNIMHFTGDPIPGNGLTPFERPDMLKRSDEIVQSIISLYQDQQAAFGAARKKLWQLLGQMYEASSHFGRNDELKAVLANAVAQVPSVAASKRWKADKKSVFDLLVTLVLGLEEQHKPTKSQWLSALKRAESSNIERSQDAFVDWISGNGGINSHRPTVTPDFDKELAEIAKKLGSAVESFSDLVIPDDANEGDMVIVIAKAVRRGGDDPSTAHELMPLPYGVIKKPSIVLAAGTELARLWDATERWNKARANEEAKKLTPQNAMDGKIPWGALGADPESILDDRKDVRDANLKYAREVLAKQRASGLPKRPIPGYVEKGKRRQKSG